MKRFSFFSRFLGGGAEIRGTQMAKYLNGRVNPKDDFADDVCIFILGVIPENEPRKSYYDVMDCGFARLRRVNQKTNGEVIATSESQYVELLNYFSKRKVFLIPQHHCNFKKEKRPKRQVKVVGCIGGDSAVQWQHYAVERLLKEVGLEWEFCHSYSKREYVVDFYKRIDIQLSFRPTHPRGLVKHMNCLKLANAGSFGIPTIAYPEPAYVLEWKDKCLFSESIYELVKMAKRLSVESGLYDEASEKAFIKSQEYDIEKIVNLYEGLS